MVVLAIRNDCITLLNGAAEIRGALPQYISYFIVWISSFINYLFTFSENISESKDTHTHTQNGTNTLCATNLSLSRRMKAVKQMK